MPTTSVLLDIAVPLIDSAFIGFWALIGTPLVIGAVDLVANVWRRWRGR